MSTAGPSSNTMDGFAIITSLGRRIGGRKIGIEYSTPISGTFSDSGE